tara:strand:- start:7880 stop:8371 length:492 start_codon:yes stop_codon:yes gene_type:complete
MTSFFSDPSSWVLVAFIIFVIIALVIKAPSMIAGILDGEIKKIKEELDNARNLKEEANSLLAQHERKIQNADEEAEKIISQAREIALNQEAQSKLKAEEYVKRAEQQAIEKIERAEKIAIAKINDQIVSNSIELSKKIIMENIDENSSKKLVQQSIQQINKLK